jgi:putative acetyltransferase
MNTLQIRPATIADAEDMVRTHFAAVHGIASDFYPPEVLEHCSRQPDETSYHQVRQSIMNDDELCLVAEDDAGVVGFGSIVPALQELRSLYVHPCFGRRGVGAMLLVRLEQQAIAQGVEQLHMDASLNAEAFYRRQGYEVIERGVHRFHMGQEMACVKMRKALMTCP